MEQWQKNLWALTIGVFVTNVSFILVVPFIPDLLRELGMKENIPIWTGMAISSSFLVSGLMAPVWGSLADRYGKRVMLMRSGYGMAVVLVLMGFITNEWQFLFCRILYGLLAGFIPSSIMLTVSNTPQRNMGYALGVLNTAIALGGIMGPFVGGALVQYMGIRASIFLAAVILVGGTTLSVFGTRENIIKQAKPSTIIQDVRVVVGNKKLQVYFFCMFVLQTVTFMFLTTLPLRIVEMTSTNTQLATGIVFSVTGISLAIGSVLAGRITRISYAAMLLGGLLLSGALCVIQGITASIVLLGVTRFFFGFTNAAVNVSGNVLITESSDEEMRGRVFGVLNSFTNFGAVIGPLFGGLMGEHFSNATSFHGCAVFFFLAAYVLWKFRLKKYVLVKSG